MQRLFALAPLLAALPARANVQMSAPGGQRTQDGKVLQEMKIEAPGLDEEDQYGYNMPDKYLCNACKAVVFHVEKEMTAKHPKGRDWKESELLDFYDDVCKGDTFEGYGIKLINGQNVLGGPAVQEEQEKLAPGQASIQMGGDSWKKRLGEECRKLVYERYGEEEVYEAWKNKELNQSWCVEDKKARKLYKCEAAATSGKKAKKDKKKKKKDKKKDKKKEKKEKKPSGMEKKMTAEAYLNRLASQKGVKVNGAKTETEWFSTLKPLFDSKRAGNEGNDEL